MKPLHLLPIATATLIISFPFSVAAQNCTSDNVVSRNSEGEPVITAASCFSPIELRSSLASAKGSYANALQVTQPNVGSKTCSLNSATSNCVGYTGQCGVCGNDPNAQPGEITCWCQPPASLTKNQHPNLSAGGVLTFQTKLLVDKNNDGVLQASEPSYSSAPSRNPGRSAQQRTYTLHPELIRQDWEDQFQNGNGDFNDFVTTLDARICGKGAFPLRAIQGDLGFGCDFDCFSNYDPSCATKLPSVADLKFHIAIGVDRLTSDRDRETSGRAIEVTVSSYGKGTSVLGHNFAVCPILYFSPAGNALATDSIVKMNYGSSGTGTCTRLPANQGLPYCGSPLTPAQFGPSNVYPISFARGQTYTPGQSCSSRTVNDVFYFTSDAVCSSYGEASSLHTESFEVFLPKVDRAISNTNQQFSQFTYAQIVDRLKFINLVVVRDPPAGFFCPAGPNATIGAVDFSTMGYAFQFSYTPTANAVTLYERQ